MQAIARFLIVCWIVWPVCGNENWPDFRGPFMNGCSDSVGLPTKWSETQNIKWKTAIHDHGWSSPVVWGNQIWLTTAHEKGYKMYAVCVDLETGKIVHDLQLFDQQDPQKINRLNSYATPSPVIEPGRVYVHFGTFGTACLDTGTGQILWKRTDLNCEHMHGPVSSPVLFEDLLILHLEGTDAQYIVALDKATGQTAWRTDRPQASYGTLKSLVRYVYPGYDLKAFSTPLIIEIAGKCQMISSGAQGCHAYDPRTGKEYWRVWYGGDATVSRPVASQGLVFINTGRGDTRLLAVRPDGQGDVSASHVVWKIKEKVPAESSPAIVGELIYMVDDNGTATCLEADTGKVVWRQRLDGRYGASPVYADGRVYFFNKDGKTTVVREGRTFESVVTNQLDAGFGASPAIVGKSFVIRTRTHLYRIEEQKRAG